MRRRFALFLLLTSGASIAVVAIAACSAPEAPPRNGIAVRDDDSGKRTKDTGADPEEEEPKPEEDPPLPDGGKPPGRVYAHTADTLYLYEPLAKTFALMGKFSCLKPGDRMLDVALDRDGVMYGTSDRGFLTISPVDATCSYVKEDVAAKYPNSLAFVPLGTVDPTKETLVGYQFAAVNEATVFVKIDVATGAVTKIGDLNDPIAAIKYRASGDVISLIRNGKRAYLTVKTISPDAGTGNDYLAEIDPSNGRLKAILGDIKAKDLFGFGYWAGTGYGFSGGGQLIEINMTNGTSTVLATTVDGGKVSWFGAGVTTDSPTKP
jgi:hypothetical protein